MVVSCPKHWFTPHKFIGQELPNRSTDLIPAWRKNDALGCSKAFGGTKIVIGSKVHSGFGKKISISRQSENAC
jgi:uncharacterized Zn-binding protein involved in type VI secretion